MQTASISSRAHGYCPIILAFGETRAFMSGSFSSGCPLLALLLQSSPDSTAAASVDQLLLEDIRFAAEELRPLIRTRSGDAVRAFFPNRRAAAIDEEAEAAVAQGEGGEERQELGGLLEVVMTQDEKDRGKRSNGGDTGK